ncbi:MAG: VWA domain-containing protein [Chamaesiphon sp. CSU_1_12]|nr:VWA domain-containing protein [Chamaesiphon sp. CSU_1_12]
MLLDQDIANQYLLQGHPQDVTTVIVFNDTVINANELERWTVTGNDPQALRGLYRQIEALNANGGTNIFDSTRVALQYLAGTRTQDCLPAVILMTDGQDTVGNQAALNQYIQSNENDIPVFAITFGAADDTQLTPITTQTYGRIFRGSEDLIKAFREAKGYN